MAKTVLLASICYILITSVLSQSPLVTINNGMVSGKTMFTALTNTPFSAFVGIPYAKPPLGNLRFEPPQPAENWTGIFYALQSPSHCVQGNPPTGSENCLYVNVFVPDVKTNCPAQMNVLLFIHGGGFTGGDSSYENLNQDSIMEVGCMVSVTFNYRLGCIGFLSSGDSEISGNGGLKDQVLAMQWVHDNIGYFGGNPNNVTLVGQSAGAISVGLHLETPNAGVLFHAAVLQSGSSLCDWARDRSTPTQLIHSLGSSLSLNGTTTGQLKQQLQSIDANTLQITCDDLVTSSYAAKTPRDGIIFGPVIEPVNPGAFKTQMSVDLWERGLIKPNVPVMIGATSYEINFGTTDAGLINTTDLLSPIFKVILLKGAWVASDLVPISMNLNNILTKTLVGLQIRDKYNFPLNPLILPSKEQADELNDDMAYRPIAKAASLYFASNLKTYVYIFDYCGDASCMNAPPRLALAPTHGEDLGYIFTNGVGMSARDTAMKNVMGNLLGNFVKYHNPTVSGLPFTWDTTDANLRYLNINDNSVMVATGWRKSYLIDFWGTLFNLNGHPPYDTY